MDLVIHSDDEDDTDDEYHERYPRPSHQVSGELSNAYLGYPTLHLFKGLEIAIDEASIYSGAALRMLSCPPYDGCPFPQVRKLLQYLITEDTSECHTTRSPEDKANISTFVRRVMEMAPMASSIHVIPECLYIPPEINSPNFNDLISQLFRLATRVKVTRLDNLPVPVRLHLDGIYNLAHIKYTVAINADQFMFLARQNAPTLQSLYLRSIEDFGIAGLIRNADGGYVAYPLLHTLKLREMPGMHNPAQSVSQSVVLFPSLRHVQVEGDYPFGDDTLFRGNSTILESFVLLAYSSLVSVLHQRGVFMPTSHPKLQCVIFEHLGRLVPDTFATSAEGIQYALSIGSRAPVREIDGVPAGDELLSALSLPGSHYSIQVLSIPDTQLDIWQAISLIKSLPLLYDLHAPLPNTGPVPDGVTMDELSAYMMSTYALMTSDSGAGISSTTRMALSA